jgi:hypothetical protein
LCPKTTQSDHRWPVVANLVSGLQPTALDQIWVADITYIRLDEGFVYLARGARCLQPQGGGPGTRRPSALE